MSDLSKMTNYFLKKECQKYYITWPKSRNMAIKLLQRARTTNSCENAERKRKRTSEEYLLIGWELYEHHSRAINAKYADENCTEYNMDVTLMLLKCEVMNYTCTMEIESTLVTVKRKTLQEIEADLIHPGMIWQPWVPGDEKQIDWIKIGVDFANKKKKFLWNF